MEALSTSHRSKISSQKLVSLVRELIGVSGYEDPDNPQPPGPWDPYIRTALDRLKVFGPLPDPWRSVFGPFPQPWVEVALNPQPLPPKAAFAAAIAAEVIDRLALIQEIADAMSREGEQGIIIVGGHLSRFIDDCGNGRLWRKRPFPPPKSEDDHKLTALELIVMGAVFEEGARTAANEQLQQEFRNAGARLAEMGIARM